MKKRILCMGSINIDLTMFTNELPKPGESIKTDNFQTFPGGKGGNQSATIALLGGNVRFFTKMGDDDFSKTLIDKQKKDGVDTSTVIIEKGETSGVAMIMVDSHAQNSILFTPGANGHMTAHDVREHADIFDECDILQLTMEIPTDACYEAIRIAKSKGKTIVLDPAPAPKGGIPHEIARLVDYTKPNETEAKILTGIKVDSRESAEKALVELHKLGFTTPILSIGNKGAMVYSENEFSFYKPFDLDSIDTTAAGDIFIASFTEALSEGKTLHDCMIFASAAASLSTTVKGAQTSIPSVKKIYELITGKK
jgi:ribokinase